MAKVELTKEDLGNIFSLISVAPIKGSEAPTVAILQQKIRALLQDNPEKEDVKTDK